jgi:hypothetical protein
MPSIASAGPSVPTIPLAAPPLSQSPRSPDLTQNVDAGRRGAPEPLKGKRISQIPKNSVLKISEDGSVVAAWTDVFEPPEKEDGAETRYLLAKRVDDDKEFFRLMLEYPAGNEYQICKPRRGECPEAVLRQRKEREQQFLSRHHWNELDYFSMEYVTKADEFHNCERPQRLTFPDLDISFDDLILRISKPSGDLLLERKLPGWNALIKPSRPGVPSEYYVMLVAIDFSRRVLVLALDYCAPGSATDFNLRFHAVRLPQL